MAEPTSTVVAATAAAASSLALIATSLGVPAPVVLAAILGGTIAVSSSGKLELSWRSLVAALGAFCVAVGLGIWGGALAARLATGLLNAVLPSAAVLPQGLADPFFTLLLAMFGQRELLPLALAALRRKAGEV